MTVWNTPTKIALGAVGGLLLARLALKLDPILNAKFDQEAMDEIVNSVK